LILTASWSRENPASADNEGKFSLRTECTGRDTWEHKGHGQADSHSLTGALLLPHTGTDGAVYMKGIRKLSCQGYTSKG